MVAASVKLATVNGQRPGAPVLCALTLWLAAVLVGMTEAFAQGPGPVISDIRIVGNQRVESDAIKVHIASQVGQTLDESVVDQDVKNIFRMGFFERASAGLEHRNGKTILVFYVRERPLVTDVSLRGMKNLQPSDEDVIEATKVHSGSIIDPARVRATISALEKLYEDKGYLDAKVNFKEQREPGNTAKVIFNVTEGPLVQIQDIRFTGNKAFSSRRLRAAMETSIHHWVLSWIFNMGVLDRKKLQQDTDRITAFYYDSGYINVHVSEPIITREGNSLVVTIHIDEGPQYKFGTVALGGQLKFPRNEVAKNLTIQPGEVFSGTEVQHNVLVLSDFYSNRGYAYVNIDPRTDVDPAKHVVRVTFDIKPGNEVLIDRINISGNTKTADKVIRREMEIQEQEPYSTENIEDSKRRLDALGFFQTTRITTAPAPRPDEVNLNVAVQEGNTSSFQLGGGYDSLAGIFGTFTLGNTNLFGGGESAMFNAELGYLFQNFSLSYTEPWFLDIPLSVSLQVFDNSLFLFSFNQTATGFAINTYYPLTELGLKKIFGFPLTNTRVGLGYLWESVGIEGFAPFATFQLTQYGGYSRVSEVTPSIKRFTVDNPIDPREGSVQSLNVELAGIGGVPFVKGVAHGRWFFPVLKSKIFGDWVYSPGVTFGIGQSLNGTAGGNLPLFSRFFPGGLGGEGDVRGYELYSLGPQVTLFSQQGIPFAVEQIGGSKMLLISNMITFPLISAFGLRGEVFVDSGQAYLLSQSITPSSLQYAYGVGLFWKSPFGPINIDVGIPINPRPNDRRLEFDFGAGAPL